MTEPKQSKTGTDNPTTEVDAISDFDYVTVVGCSNPQFFDSWSPVDLYRNFKSKQRGDKVWFINHGIRQIQRYPKGKPDYSVQRVFLIFTENYPRKLLDEVKRIVEEDYGASYRELTSISGLLDFVTQRKRKKRLIKQMDFYCHGVVMQIEFGYATDLLKTNRLGSAQAWMLDPLAFDDDAKIFSYACRTGLGCDIGDKLDSGEDPKYADSLAQILADAADVDVWAFPRRTSYADTFGNQADRKRGVETQKKMQEYKQENNQYVLKNNDYQNRALVQSKGTSKEIPGESPPSSPVKPYTDEEERLAMQMKNRDGYEKHLDFEVPLDRYGAMHPVGSGDTPEGLPMGAMGFKPKAKK